MQKDIDHVAGSIHYCYTNVRPCDLMEIITVMGGEGRAGVWLEGNNDAESHMRNFEFDDAKRQLLIEDSKLSNEELQKKYRLSTLTSDLTEDSLDKWLSGLVGLKPVEHIEPLVLLNKHLAGDEELVKILRQNVDGELHKLKEQNIDIPELPEAVKEVLPKELLENKLMSDLLLVGCIAALEYMNCTSSTITINRIVTGIDLLFTRWFLPHDKSHLRANLNWKKRTLYKLENLTFNDWVTPDTCVELGVTILLDAFKSTPELLESVKKEAHLYAFEEGVLEFGELARQTLPDQYVTWFLEQFYIANADPTSRCISLLYLRIVVDLVDSNPKSDLRDWEVEYLSNVIIRRVCNYLLQINTISANDLVAKLRTILTEV